MKCRTPNCSREAEPDDEYGHRDYCGRCEDRLIDRANKRREWDYYHPGQPCPRSELE